MITTSQLAFLKSRLLKPLFACFLAVSVLAAPAAMAAKAKDQASIAQVRISINSASAEELSSVLKGVGAKKAEAIVKYRKANGKFKSLDELASVKGIGEAIIEKNRSNLTL